MIILIDGTLCSGKTNTGFVLEQKLSNYDAVRFDSDEERFRELPNLDIQEGDCRILAHYMNDPFCRNFSKLILEEAAKHSIVIVSMCLAGDSAKRYIVEGIKDRFLHHFILSVSYNVLYRRAESDKNPTRDAYLAERSYERITKYYEENYQSAVRIDTDNITVNDTVNFILNEIGYESIESRASYVPGDIDKDAKSGCGYA